MMPPFTRLTLAFTLTATIHLSAVADVILLRQAIEETPGNSTSGLERPTSGLSMAEVMERFGEPLERRPSVGDPPITRWIYHGYTVYFEHNRAINAVVRRPSAIETPQTDSLPRLTHSPTSGDQPIR